MEVQLVYGIRVGVMCMVSSYSLALSLELYTEYTSLVQWYGKIYVVRTAALDRIDRVVPLWDGIDPAAGRFTARCE